MLTPILILPYTLLVMSSGDTPFLHQVTAISHPCPATIIVRLERRGLIFQAGQYLTVGLANSYDLREYTIFSGIHDPYLEILIKIVPGGLVSNQLAIIQVGQYLRVEGPFGRFMITDPPQALTQEPLLFIASGTGISPFRSYVRSYPQLNYRLIHGLRNLSEHYSPEDFASDSRVRCTSRSHEGEFAGRITDYLVNFDLGPFLSAHLCGNADMIYDAYGLLLEKGFQRENIATEVYF
jgi:ferredoxin/flavodoxin---NADP+ reductase